MSADNGVYILITKAIGGKKEYRVTEAQAIENIDWSPDYPVLEPALNREWTLFHFGNARVYTDRRLAVGYAHCTYDMVMRDRGVVEYGIQFLDFSHVRFPAPRQQKRDRTSGLKLSAVG